MFKAIKVSIFMLTGCLGLAQTTFQEQAARLQNINAYLLDFRPAAAPRTTSQSELELTFDINPQPSIDPRVGLKDEEIDPPSVVPKIRGRYLHRSGVFFGAAVAPGIEFQDYEAEYLSFEVGYRRSMASLMLGIRGSYSDGDVEGPVTEKGVNDLFTFENKGLDISAGYPWRHVVLYAFAGWNDIETSLDIEVDGVRLVNSDDTYYGGLGGSYRRGRYGINFEQNITDDYLQHMIISFSYWF